MLPVLNPRFGMENKDILLQCYQAYRNFLQMDDFHVMGNVRKSHAQHEYETKCKDIISYLQERCRGKIKSEDDISMLLHLYYPMEEIDREMGIVEKICSLQGYCSTDEGNISVYYLKKLSGIATSLITYRDGVAAIRQ